jgi:sarcosine oxidase
VEQSDVIVVGAGITGLAAAYELARRGVDVLVLERSGVAAEQSAGLARIFRVLHGDPRLCALAMDALVGWRRWEAELDCGRLLGSEGLVSAGPLIEDQRAAMQAAGADVRSVDGDEIAHLVPHLASHPDWAHGIVDPAAGSIRIRRAQDALAARLTIRPADVVALDDTEAAASASVRLSGGTTLRAGHVVVCAGTATGPLVAPLGIDLDLQWSHHVRLTYAARSGVLAPTAALVLESAYGLPIGTTGRWGLGLHDPGPPAPIAEISEHDYAAEVRRQHAAWVAEHMPSLDPAPIDEIRCVSLDAPWLDARGDGFIAARSGHVVACTGSNMMKFGPLLGERLAATILEGDGIHADLQPRITSDDPVR